MDASSLRELQAPLKAAYRERPEAAFVTLRAAGDLAEGAIACKVETGHALVEAGLHPATGGSGLQACSGDMLWKRSSLAPGDAEGGRNGARIPPEGRLAVRAEGDLDFRGTLGVERTAPVGFRDIRLGFELDTDEEAGAGRDAAEADRALLRGAADPVQPTVIAATIAGRPDD
jgi:hypothetical protein